MNATEFVRSVAAVNSPNAFNPYSMRCTTCDIDVAPEQRARILQRILQRAACVELDSLWIGRDLGYRGGRRSGLALTDDVHVSAHAMRWGVAAQRSTQGAAVVERTAAIIWQILTQVSEPVFLWNVFPLHPHEPNNPFSNRSHTSAERQLGEDILVHLIALIRPRRIIAIGNDAATVAQRLTHGRVERLRHPSYGGQNDFIEQARKLYGIPKRQRQLLVA